MVAFLAALAAARAFRLFPFALRLFEAISVVSRRAMNVSTGSTAPGDSFPLFVKLDSVCPRFFALLGTKDDFHPVPLHQITPMVARRIGRRVPKAPRARKILHARFILGFPPARRAFPVRSSRRASFHTPPDSAHHSTQCHGFAPCRFLGQKSI